jgi:hypothetical protein
MDFGKLDFKQLESFLKSEMNHIGYLPHDRVVRFRNCTIGIPVYRAQQQGQRKTARILLIMA